MKEYQLRDWGFTRNEDGSVTIISCAHIAAGSGKWEHESITLTSLEWAEMVVALSQYAEGTNEERPQRLEALADAVRNWRTVITEKDVRGSWPALQPVLEALLYLDAEGGR